METKSADKPATRRNAGTVDTKMVLVIVAIFFMAAILVTLMILVLTLRKNAENASYVSSVSENQRQRVEYATEGVTVVDDANALQKAVDELMSEPNDPIALLYENDAWSHDGQNFDCYIANSYDNDLDAFFTIATDVEMKDIVYVSGLLRPGQALEKISLERSLEQGDYTLFVGISLVREENGEQVLDRQLVYNVDFHVS